MKLFMLYRHTQIQRRIGVLLPHLQKSSLAHGSLSSTHTSVKASKVTNPFKSLFAAEQYRKGRPNIHMEVAAKICHYLGLSKPLNLALDVACGTGLSSIALTRVAHHVIGIDASEAMLKVAEPSPNVEYFHASAEAIPFQDVHFDFIAIACGFHWVNQQAFLCESARVLRDNGFMVIYDNAFTGIVQNNAPFGQWFKNVFMKKFPLTKRFNKYPTKPDAIDALEFIGREDYQNSVSMYINQIVDYFMTMSNVAHQIEQHEISTEAARAWVANELVQLCQESHQTLIFGGAIYYFKRMLRPELQSLVSNDAKLRAC